MSDETIDPEFGIPIPKIMQEAEHELIVPSRQNEVQSDATNELVVPCFGDFAKVKLAEDAVVDRHITVPAGTLVNIRIQYTQRCRWTDKRWEFKVRTMSGDRWLYAGHGVKVWLEVED